MPSVLSGTYSPGPATAHPPFAIALLSSSYARAHLIRATRDAKLSAYVEIDLPSNAVPTHVGPRNTAVIPSSGPLPIGGLNPTFVPVRRWWNLWYFWR